MRTGKTREGGVPERLELTRLFYHLCRKEERNPVALDQLLIRRGMAGSAQERYLGILPEWEKEPEPEDLFLQVAWQEWEKQDWVALVCHPNFIQEQKNERFLRELCTLLEQEQLYNREGISQDLYFALCLAYHFFEEEEDSFRGDVSLESGTTLWKEKNEGGEKSASGGTRREEILLEAEMPLEGLAELLSRHPNHAEYLQDLRTWEELKRDARLVAFCQWATRLAGKRRIKPAEQEAFLEEAEELFLPNSTPKQEFILQNLNRNRIPGVLPLLSVSFLFSRKQKKMQSFQAQGRVCFQVFSDLLLDVAKEGHSPYQAGYLPLKKRLKQFQRQYHIYTETSEKKAAGKKGNKTVKQKNPIYSQAFLEELKKRMVLPAYSTVYPYVPYVIWRALRQWFGGDTSLEQEVTEWLRLAAYFPVYEKRWQKEMEWREQQAENAFFKEVVPFPELSQGKKELLEKVLQGTPSELHEVQKIFRTLSFGREEAEEFWIRLTNAMVRCKFLLIRQKHEPDPVPEDAVCFLKEEVILYREKEHQTCRMSPLAFLDMLSRSVDLLAQKESVPGEEVRYTERFLETVCKNLYLYECAIDFGVISS